MVVMNDDDDDDDDTYHGLQKSCPSGPLPIRH